MSANDGWPSESVPRKKLADLALLNAGLLEEARFALILVALLATSAWILDEPGGNQLTLVPGALLLLMAPVIVRWGYSQGILMRRLALSSDLSQRFDPQHGLHRATCELAEILRRYQGADACMVMVEDPRSADWTQYLIEPDGELSADAGKRIAPQLLQSLLAVPADHAVLYCSRRPWRRRFCRACDCATLDSRPADAELLGVLAELLEAESFISLPLRSRNQTIGRLHLVSRRRRYTPGDLRFLTQIVAQVGLMIDNVLLIEQLVREAASEERQKISRDLHDDAIQPYVGLKLCLEALRRRLDADDPAAPEVEDLIAMVNDGVVELRQYVGGLKRSERIAPRGSLLPAVRRQAEKFRSYYGIDTRVAGESDVVVGGSLLEEVVHIVREGLSNIRRHTAAQHAAINIRARDRRLVLEIINDNACEVNGATHFFPRSIGERARELGGRVAVEHRNGGRTAVAVEIPL